MHEFLETMQFSSIVNIESVNEDIRFFTTELRQKTLLTATLTSACLWNRLWGHLMQIKYVVRQFRSD